MPRYSKRDQTRRYQFNDKDTHDYTTPALEVFARPQDIYEKPGDPSRVIDQLGRQSADTKAFNAIMDNLSGALTAGVKVKAIMNEREQQAGQRAAATGQDAPDDAGDHFLYGHELISGKASAGELTAALTEYHESAKDADPMAYAAGKDKLIRQFTQGRSAAFMDGLLPDAIQLDREYTVKYRNYTMDKIKTEGVAKLSMGFENDIRRIYGDMTMNREQRAQAAREVLTGVQDLGMGTYGVGRLETSAAMVGVLNRVSEDLADPSIIGDVSQMSHSGVRLIDNPKLAPLIEKGINSASSEMRRVSEEQKRYIKERKNEIENQIQTTIMHHLMQRDTESLRKARELLMAYGTPEGNPDGVVVNPSVIASGYSLLEQGSDGFARNTDYSKFDVAYDRAIKGTLSLEDLVAIRPYVSEEKYNSVRAVLYRQGSKATRSPERQEFDKRMGDTMAVVDTPDKMLRMIDNNGKMRRQYVRDYAMSWWQDEAARNNKEPTVEEQRQQLKALEQEAKLKFPPMMFNADTGAPVAEPVEAPSKPAPKLSNVQRGSADPTGQRAAPQPQGNRATDALNRVRAKNKGE